MGAAFKKRKKLYEVAQDAFAAKKRLVAPLAGFPGCEIINVSIKVAQQNHGIHYRCIEALANTLKPDMAFMMMDLSVEANALGLRVRFPTDESSTVEHHPVESLDELDDFSRINILQDARIQSYIKTIEMMSTGLPADIMKCAYVIGPVTLAGLLETAQRVALDSILEPQRLDTLCRFTTDIIRKYATALVNAGADAICILEPTGSILGPDQFDKFSVKYVRHIIESYMYSGVDTIYHVCGNTMHLVKSMAASGVGAISIDSPDTGIDLPKVAGMLPENVVVIGNIDPTRVMKDGSVKDVQQAATDLLQKMRPYPNFILSTACDLPPGTPMANMLALIQTARQFK